MIIKIILLCAVIINTAITVALYIKPGKFKRTNLNKQARQILWEIWDQHPIAEGDLCGRLVVRKQRMKASKFTSTLYFLVKDGYVCLKEERFILTEKGEAELGFYNF